MTKKEIEKIKNYYKDILPKEVFDELVIDLEEIENQVEENKKELIFLKSKFSEEELMAILLKFQ